MLTWPSSEDFFCFLFVTIDFDLNRICCLILLFCFFSGSGDWSDCQSFSFYLLIFNNNNIVRLFWIFLALTEMLNILLSPSQVSFQTHTHTCHRAQCRESRWSLRELWWKWCPGNDPDSIGASCLSTPERRERWIYLLIPTQNHKESNVCTLEGCALITKYHQNRTHWPQWKLNLSKCRQYVDK